MRMDTSLGARAIAANPADARARIGRLAWVLMALGLAAWWPELSAWAGRLLGMLAFGRSGPGGWGEVLGASQPTAMLWRCWPLALAIALGLTRWPNLLLGASATFVLLGLDLLGTVAIAVADLSGSPGGRWGPRLVAPAAARVALGGMALAAGGRAWSLRRAWRRTGQPARVDLSRPPAISGRLTAVGALVFALMVGSATLWSVYERFALRSPALRDWLSGVRPGQHEGVERLLSPRERRMAQAAADYGEGYLASRQGRYAEARRAFVRSIRGYESLAEDDTKGRTYARGRALGLNNLAWLMTTCPDRSVRDYEEAIALAERAVELAPEEGNYWNTLAAALYEARRTEEAEAAFERSMGLRDGGDAFDWFYLARLAGERGESDTAVELYERASAWRDRTMPHEADLYQIHLDAARALGLDTPPPPEELASDGRGSARARRLPIPAQPPTRGMMEE
jgi:tetratricopeptide (TPR) repeat protein